MSQGQIGTPEFFGLMDKHIGRNLSYIEADSIYLILKAFYDSGYARPKLFIKLQPNVIEHLDSLDVNTLTSILRLYSEMDVQ